MVFPKRTRVAPHASICTSAASAASAARCWAWWRSPGGGFVRQPGPPPARRRRRRGRRGWPRSPGSAPRGPTPAAAAPPGYAWRSRGGIPSAFAALSLAGLLCAFGTATLGATCVRCGDREGGFLYVRYRRCKGRCTELSSMHRAGRPRTPGIREIEAGTYSMPAARGTSDSGLPLGVGRWTELPLTRWLIAEPARRLAHAEPAKVVRGGCGRAKRIRRGRG